MTEERKSSAGVAVKLEAEMAKHAKCKTNKQLTDRAMRAVQRLI